jgi:signal transduction histidine kinase/ligand-binding sensor domain-containing protein/DNA-binding response OmpR family regulator
MKKIYLTFCFLIAICSAIAQNNVYRFKNISTGDGLSQSAVIAIHQDKMGQMWFGTRDGLNKYDGSKFQVYRTNVNDSLSISNNDILCITEDSSGNIWVGTYNGLNKYNPVDDTFQRYFHGNEQKSLSNNAIWSIQEIGGTIWAGTSNGLTIYDKKTNQFTSFYHTENNSFSLPSNYVLSINQTPNGKIWIGTSKGFSQAIPDKKKGYTFKTSNQNSSIPLFVQITKQDEKGNLWIGTKNRGLFYYDNQKEELLSLEKRSGFEKIGTDIRAITIDKQNSLWIGSYNGVTIIDKNKKATNIDNSENPNVDKVKALFTDKKGSVWMGCYYKGINLWDVSNANFTNYNQHSKENKLSFDVVSSIVKDRNNNIYFGTEGGGITIFEKHSGKTSQIFQNPNKKGAIDDIKSLHYAADQTLWVGTFSSGFISYNTISKTINHDAINPELKKLIAETGVYAIKEDKNGVLWLGTFGKGLIRYDLKTKTYTTFTTENGKTNSLTNNRIRTLLLNKDEIWVGTQNGLNVISTNVDPSKKKPIKYYFFDSVTLSGDDILTLFSDHKNSIWVGTKAKGLFVLKNGALKNVKIIAKNGLITAVHSVLEDKANNLWLSTNQGIIKYNTLSQKTTVYDQKDGVVSNEFNDNACLQLGDNEYYFGGPSGATYFNSQKIALNQYAPKVLLTNISIKNKDVKPSKTSSILQKNLLYTEKIKLPYDQSNFSISFSIPNFIRSKNNQYRYRLVGLDNTWTTTKNPDVSFAIQNAGSYTLEVYGANNDGVWTTTPTILQIEITPAPWRTLWALLFYFIVIALSIYGLIWIINSKEKLNQKLQLEYIEAERIKENNRVKLDFFTNISHEFRTPLTLISGPLQQLLADYNGTNEMYKKLLVIESSTTHLLELINRLMDFRKLESNKSKLETAKGNIVKFTKEIYLAFIEYAKDGNYTFTFETSDDEIYIYFDRYKLERVFFNLISNAFRYTPEGGTINIRLRHDESTFYFDIEDSGVGIAPEHISHIFELFYEVPIHNQEQNNYTKGTGIGLSIVKNIVHLHQGIISVANKTTQGVIFSLTLPKGKKHLNQSEIIKDFKISDDISQYTSQLSIFAQPIDQDDISDNVHDDNKPTILVVEDHKVLRSFIKNLLKTDYNVITADNGKTGLKKALKNIPNLIVSDVIMPEMVGTELCAKIKENPKTSHIPVILLTSRSSLIYKFEGLDSGADDYISKPFNLQEFKLRIKNSIESAERLKTKFTKEDIFTPSQVVLSSSEDELLKKAFKIVEDNISNTQFDIPHFCAELGISRTLLFTKIKTWTNCTPNEFIHEIRLKSAAQMLEQNKINISQVSYKVGFNNPKYFSKCFQKKFGITPAEYVEKFHADIL